MLPVYVIFYEIAKGGPHTFARALYCLEINGCTLLERGNPRLISSRVSCSS